LTGFVLFDFSFINTTATHQMGYTKRKKSSAKKVTKKASPLMSQQSVDVDDCRDAEFKELILTNFVERIWPTLRDAGFDSMKS